MGTRVTVTAKSSQITLFDIMANDSVLIYKMQLFSSPGKKEKEKESEYSRRSQMGGREDHLFLRRSGQPSCQSTAAAPRQVLGTLVLCSSLLAGFGVAAPAGDKARAATGDLQKLLSHLKAFIDMAQK